MVYIKNNNTKSILIGVISSIVFFFIFGIITAVVPNSLFTRMTPVTLIEYTSLFLTSLLLGVYFGLSYYEKKIKSGGCDAVAAAGGIAGFLTFGCAICNKLLVLLLGVTGVLKYFEPIRPVLGFVSVGLLSIAIIYKIKHIKKKISYIKRK